MSRRCLAWKRKRWKEEESKGGRDSEVRDREDEEKSEVDEDKDGDRMMKG